MGTLSLDCDESQSSDLWGDDKPVVCVSWGDVQRFLWQLNTIDAANSYRLPTEAEWEYAARGGTTTRYSWGDDPNKSTACRYANLNASNCSDGYAQTAPVGLFRPNNFQLYDMSGNVAEWVQDWYDPSYFSINSRH
jgi:formylglycine-generating enzyme required for sulfatase activity